VSASIYYQPVKGKHLSIGAPSSFIAAMTRAFGNYPWTLTDRDYHKLLGLAAGLDSDDQRAAVEELAEAAMASGEIRVWAEY
jgi:hypothetical protein